MTDSVLRHNLNSDTNSLPGTGNGKRNSRCLVVYVQPLHIGANVAPARSELWKSSDSPLLSPLSRTFIAANSVNDRIESEFATSEALDGVFTQHQSTAWNRSYVVRATRHVGERLFK